VHAKTQRPSSSVLNNWRDVIIINDEAHHAYGEKRTKKGEEPNFSVEQNPYTRSKATRVSLVVDMSATPWYGLVPTSPKLALRMLICDFSSMTPLNPPRQNRFACQTRTRKQHLH